MVTFTQFKERVIQRGGFSEPQNAERAIDATLQALGEHLSPNPARVVRRRLPEALANKLGVSAPVQDSTPRLFYERVAELEDVRLSVGLEHAQVVCEVLAESIDEEARAYLRADVPPGLRELFELHPPPEPPEGVKVHDPVAQQGLGSTLASGRMGSTTPLSEGAAERAQRHSIMQSDNPHEDTKISSATEAPPHRATPLSEGHVGSTHPLSKAKD